MSSLGITARQKKETPNASQKQGSRRVLPRVFRKPARLFNRLMAGDVNVSRKSWFMIFVAGSFVAATGTYNSSRGTDAIVADVSARMGFTIDSVNVSGVHELHENDILAHLDLGKSKSLFSFDIDHARTQLRKLRWVKDAVVAKSYPNQLSVRISERAPFAIWQNGKSLTLVERDGSAIGKYDDRHSSLPLLVGEGANKNGAQIVYQINKFESLASQMKAYVRVGNRRWDLRLKNGVIVKLPDVNVDTVLQRLATLNREHKLVERDIKSVDFRLKDRIVVLLGDDTTGARGSNRSVVSSISGEKKI